MALKIMVVDDDKNICELLRLYLEKEGYEVQLAFNGMQALDMFRNDPPDLMLLDGGKGHVSVIRALMAQRGYDIPVFGMVKDDHHRTRAIAEDGGEIAIHAKRSAFTLVSSIQEEVHRFAISYHRQKRGKSRIRTTLTNIDGVGETRAKALLRHFGSVKAVKAATLEELCGVKGMTRPVAENIFEFFRQQQDDA